MGDMGLVERFRLWLAGALFLLSGRIHPMYRVWLDGAEPREPGDDGYRGGDDCGPCEIHATASRAARGPRP